MKAKCLQDGGWNRRGVKSKLSVVGLLIELMSDGDDESEEYNDDSLLMEIAVSR